MSTTAKATDLVQPNMSGELFAFLRKDFSVKKLRLGILTKHNEKMDALDPYAYRNYLNKLVTTNKMTALFKEDGGYDVLSPSVLASFEAGAVPDPPLVADPSPEQRTTHDKGLIRVSQCLSAIKTHKAEHKKRSDEAGILVTQGIIPTILPEAIAHLTSKWAANMSTDYFAHMNEILTFIGTFQKEYSDVSERLTNTLNEIGMARTHNDVHKLVAQFDAFISLQDEYLTRLVLDDRIPLDNNFPPKTDAYLLKQMIKKMDENPTIGRYRATVSTWIKKNRSFATLSVKLREQLDEYIPSGHHEIRTNQASASTNDMAPQSRIVEVNHTIFQDPQTSTHAQWGGQQQELEAMEYHDVPQVHANVGRSLENTHQYYLDQELEDMDYHHVPQVRAQVGRPLERTYQPAAGSQPSMWHEMYQPPSQRQRMDVPCTFNTTGTCRYGDMCRFQHTQNVCINMTPQQAQQWHVQQLASNQRDQQAQSMYQQGASPAMHPTGAYMRPPQPSATAPYYGGRTVTYNGQDGNTGRMVTYGGRGGRGPSPPPPGRGGRGY